MPRKFIYIVIVALLTVVQANAQLRPRSFNSDQSSSSSEDQEKKNNPDGQHKKDEHKKDKPKVPSFIKSWSLHNQGSLIEANVVDTTMWFYHNYMPFNQRSISNTSTGNNGGAYISNDFFKRQPNSDFYFTRSFDAYWLTPSQINYFNTTTPYTLLDYSQSENKATHNETRFNVFHSQNVNKKMNFEFIYNQTRSTGQYQHQENRFHNIALVGSYTADKFLSHSNIIFNRLQVQENGGIDPGQSFKDIETDQLTTIILDKDARSKLQNNTVYSINEYRVGKTVESKTDTSKYIVEKFIPRVGFIYEFELSTNKRSFTKTNNSSDFFSTNYINTGLTNDSTQYTRLTNLFQIKFYEAPDRKYTFGKRAYIGHDELWYRASTKFGDLNAIPFPLISSFFNNRPSSLGDLSNIDKLLSSRQTNTFVGGGLFRNEGKFWQWEADGRIYLTGYKAGQTELSGFINKPLRIGSDTTSLRIEGCLKTLVPEYYDSYFFSNNFAWKNNFNNTNEMTIRSSIHSQAFKTTVGVNYSLLSNYIYNDEKALPAQASSELLVLSAYLNKDFESKHWLIRTQFLVQKASDEDYIHLPVFAGYLSMNYRTIWSKVMHTQLGIDTRYNSAFYADAYEPATSRFYLQNKEKIGNYPYIDLHVNLKLKRTRFFFILMNAASGFVGNNYYVAPNYPYYRRTFRIGLAWSFYD